MPLSFVHPVHRATHRIGLYLDKLGEPGLTQGEAHILAMLAHSGPAKVAELHRGLAHKRSTLTTKLGMPSSVQTGQAAVAPLPAAGMSKSITLPDWTVDKWDIKTLPYTLAPGLIYSGYVFEFTASRKVEHYILKVFAWDGQVPHASAQAFDEARELFLSQMKIVSYYLYVRPIAKKVSNEGP